MNVYQKAAEFLRTHGWSTGLLENGDGPVCINGALMRAAGLKPSYQFYDDPDYVELCRPVVKFIDSDYGVDDLALTLETWNDVEAKDQADVIAVLEAVGAEYDD